MHGYDVHGTLYLNCEIDGPVGLFFCFIINTPNSLAFVVKKKK